MMFTELGMQLIKKIRGIVIYRLKSLLKFCSFARLFAKLPRPGDSEVTFAVFESSFHCYYQSNHSKLEAIPLSTLPMDTTKANLPAYLHANPFYC